MKRDRELVRNILLAVEAETDIEGDKETVDYHLYIMVQGGLIAANEIGENQWQIQGLTWEGAELLDLIRDDARWSVIDRILNDVGSASFEVIKQLARKLMDVN